MTISRAADPARPPSPSSAPAAAGPARVTTPLPPRASLHPLPIILPTIGRDDHEPPPGLPGPAARAPGHARFPRVRTGLCAPVAHFPAKTRRYLLTAASNGPKYKGNKIKRKGSHMYRGTARA
ncbi:hypothetical protein GCM10009735_42480 [Actinomadura chokoriensis]